MSVERPLRRWSRPRPLIDRTIVGGLFVLDVLSMLGASAGHKVKSPPLSGWELLVAAFSAGIFLWRRQHPVRVVILSCVAVLLAAAPRHGVLVSQSTGLTAMFATYALGSWSAPRPVTLALPAVIFAVLFAGSLGAGVGVALAIASALIALPWVAGYAARSRRLYVEQVEERLDAAERDRDERARQAARDERAHIARELHDIVAHHVSVIGVQAGAARLALDTSPNDTRAALQAIESAARQAVGEMGHLLSALREEDVAAAGTEPPQPGLGDVARLADSFRNAGLAVDAEVGAITPPLPPTLDLCCYRIIEEALTNVTRHSAAREATVRIEATPDQVEITVRDPGPASGAPPGTGRGHIGMRERVALFGGSVQTGAEGAGYVVHALLPRRGVTP